MAYVKNNSSDNQSAQDMLKKLSSQYDVDPSKKEHNPDETFEGIPTNSHDDRLDTAEFMDVFDIPTEDKNEDSSVKSGDELVIQMFDSAPLEIVSEPKLLDDETVVLTPVVSNAETTDTFSVEEIKEEEPTPVEEPKVEEVETKEEPVIFNNDTFSIPVVDVVTESAVEEPVVEEPIVEEPVVETPIVEEPVVEEPIAEEPTIEEPVVEEPIVEEPIVEEPVVEAPKPVINSAEAQQKKKSIEERFSRDPVLTNEFALSFDEMYEEPTFNSNTTTVVLEKQPEKPIEIVKDETAQAPVVKEPEAPKPVEKPAAMSNTKIEQAKAIEKSIEAQKTVAEAAEEPKTERVYNFSNFEQTNELDTDTSETVMMKAFGLDTEKIDDKADTNNKIFDTYTFSSTDEMEALPSIDDTAETTTVTNAVSEEDSDSDTDIQYEYTDPTQKQDILRVFKDKYVAAKVKMIAAAVFSIILLIFEGLPKLVPSLQILEPTVSYIIDSVIMIACSIIVFGAMIKSVLLMTKGKFNSDSILVFSFLLSLISSVIATVLAIYEMGTIELYNLPFAVCVFFSALSEFLSIRRDVYSFKIVSSMEQKAVLTKLNRIERIPEDKEFGEYMGDESNVYKVFQTDFVSDYFKKRKEISPSTNALKAFIPLSFVMAIVVAIIAKFAIQADLYQSVSSGLMTYWFSLPICAFISFVYPQYLASVKAYSNKSAIVGDTAPEDCQKISTIAFTDYDAFPPERIKVKSVKVFENYRIENIIYFASSVFSKVGGPLSIVFKQATLDSVNSDNVEINEITDTGIDAIVDGRHIVVGLPEYMQSQCFDTDAIAEEGDEAYTGQTNKRILYLACDDVVAGKFKVQYNVSADFLYIVKHLCEEGICVSIRTCDPCIDNNILYKNKMDPTEVPVRIIKGHEIAEKIDKISCTNGFVVSTGTRKGLVKTMLICDRLNKVKKANLIFKVLSVVIGIAASVLLVTMFGGTVSSIIPAIYGMFWMLPLLLVSKLFI